MPSYQTNDKAWISIDDGATKLKGMNDHTPPKITRNSIEIVEYGMEVDSEAPTSAKWDQGSVSGNRVKTDTTGQNAVIAALVANTALTSFRMYDDANDFRTVDLAKDPESVYSIMGYDPGNYDKAGLAKFSATVLLQGMQAHYMSHLTADTIAVVPDAGGDTITDSGLGFVDAGFEVGMSVFIVNGSDREGAIIKTVEAGTLTMETKDVLTAITAGSTVQVHGGYTG